MEPLKKPEGAFKYKVIIQDTDFRSEIKKCIEKRFEARPIIPKNKVKTVLNNEIETLSCATLKKHKKTFQDVEAISRALNKHFIFTNLTLDARVKLIAKMNIYHYEQKQYIVKQNSYGIHFFIIAKGKVEVRVDGKEVNILSSGDSFGELALLHDFPRSASIITLTSTYVWILHRNEFKQAIRKINQINYQENKNFLEALPLFANLTSEQKNGLLESLTESKYRPSQKIVTEGEMGGICYFIKEGTVRCTKNGEVVGEISQGGYFGEQSLLSNSVRTATVSAKTEVKCIGLSRENLEAVLGSALERVIIENSVQIIFSKSPVLKELDKQQRISLCKYMRMMKLSNGQTLISAGTARYASIYLVLQGGLKSQSGLCIKALECLGDIEVFSRCEGTFQENYIVNGESQIGVISRDQFEQILGIFSTNLKQDEVKALKLISIFKTLPQNKFLSIVKSFVQNEFEDKQVIFQQNSPGDCLFVIKEGKVDILQDGVHLRTETKYDYFGERSLLFDEARTASAVANGRVICWTLSQQDFTKNLHETMKIRLMKRIEMQDTSLEISNLKFIKVLGKGTFGTVFLVKDDIKNRLFALKVMLKENIQKYELQSFVDLETQILTNLDNDMVLKLVKNIEDPLRIYLLMEYVRGSCMFDAIREMNLLSESDSRFYIACLIVILEYLHDRDVVYRDLKPENIIIDEQGYPKLIDFGCSKILQGRTYTVVGTPHYMAPEIIIGKGYSFQVDYWSLGVILYELLFGTVPFGYDQDDPYYIYESILQRRLVFSNSIRTTQRVQDLIEQLLSLNPVVRNGGSGERLKQNSWFSGQDWDTVYSKEINPPHIPQINEIETDTLRNSCTLEQAIFSECTVLEY